MADTIRGAIDFDLMLHLGSLSNIDIYEKGIYFIQVTMKYGYDDRQKVAPVGVFSAPSTYDSFVGVSSADLKYDVILVDTDGSFVSPSLLSFFPFSFFLLNIMFTP